MGLYQSSAPNVDTGMVNNGLSFYSMGDTLIKGGCRGCHMHKFLVRVERQQLNYAASKNNRICEDCGHIPGRGKTKWTAEQIQAEIDNGLFGDKRNIALETCAMPWCDSKKSPKAKGPYCYPCNALVHERKHPGQECPDSVKHQPLRKRHQGRL